MSDVKVAHRLVLLDTNLLVLLCVGSVNPAHISRHKRLQSYDATDFQLLDELVGQAVGVLVLPNIATETSNLLRQISEPFRNAFLVSLRGLIAHSTEIYISSQAAMDDALYFRLGVADTAILAALAMRTEATLITVDHGCIWQRPRAPSRSRISTTFAIGGQISDPRLERLAERVLFDSLCNSSGSHCFKLI